MQSIELLRVLIFVIGIGSVYGLAGAITIKGLLRRRKGTPDRRSLGQRRMDWAILILAAAGVLCFTYGYLIEPYWPEIAHVQIASSKVPAGHRPIRIVQISDLHSDRTVRLENRLPELIASQKPDLIVFTGDAVNSPDAQPVFKSCLTNIARIAPTFAVKGNWDSGFGRRVNLFEGTGARELDGDAALMDIDGAPVWIAGVAVGHESRVGQVLASIPDSAFTVFLYHYPDLIPDLSTHPIDLYCAGHTHGGQVALPLYGALVTLSKFGKRYESGLYRVNHTWLYVNRGIGMEGGFAPRVRFGARPEITVIDISPGG
ncbi:MAG TPA: metallophosphoesterase [Blastocatellia bacterium]